MGNLRVIEGGGARPTDMGLATYIWVTRTGNIDSRTKVVSIAQTPEGDKVPIIDRWKMRDQVQATEKSRKMGVEGWEETEEYKDALAYQEFVLSPCYYIPDPMRPQPSFIVLCEVRTLEDNPDGWNTRAILRKFKEGEALLPHWGVQQPFPYLGKDVVDADMKEEFTLACFDAGIRLHSANDLFYWIGPRNVSQEIDAEEPCSLVIADHVILARFIYQRVLKRRGHKVGKDDWGHSAVCLSTEKSRSNPEKVKDLEVELHNLQFAKPGVTVGGSEQYRTLLTQSRDLREWGHQITKEISVKNQALNYIRVTNLPGNVDIYEAMHRILRVIVASQPKPSENPDSTEG